MSEPNISVWDAMMRSVAGLPEIDRLQVENQRLRAENAAMRPVVEAVAKLEARDTQENPVYTRDTVLHSDDINVLWIREQARAFLASAEQAVASEGE